MDASQDPLRKWVMFASGFIGWFVVNGLAWYLLTGGDSWGMTYGIPNLLLLPVNGILLLVLAITRSTRSIGFGILAALALNFFVSLVLGIFENGYCFVPFFIKPY